MFPYSSNQGILIKQIGHFNREDEVGPEEENKFLKAIEGVLCNWLFPSPAVRITATESNRVQVERGIRIHNSSE